MNKIDLFKKVFKTNLSYLPNYKPLHGWFGGQYAVFTGNYANHETYDTLISLFKKKLDCSFCQYYISEDLTKFKITSSERIMNENIQFPLEEICHLILEAEVKILKDQILKKKEADLNKRLLSIKNQINERVIQDELTLLGLSDLI